MKLPEMAFKDIRWTDLPVTTILGETGQAQAHVAEEAGLRTRVVHYDPGFVLDHFCE